MGRGADRLYDAGRGKVHATLALDVVIRDIEEIEDFRTTEDLQKEVWGIDEREITPLTQLVAAKAVGGQVIGAYADGAMVGFVYGFLGLEHGRTVHHSHMLAVLPPYRNRDVGYRLKLAQRERVLGQGIDRVTWTFDPLQSLNAHFNIGKLGVVSDAYKVDFYGETTSFLHRMGTDRLWVTWLLDSSRVRSRLRDETRADRLPARRPSGLDGQQAFIEIPADINAIQREDPELAARWRDATRRAFLAALEAGFLVEDFTRDGSLGVYVLTRGRSVEDFA